MACTYVRITVLIHFAHMLHPGNPRPGYELCLDCKLQAAEGILQHCHTGKHVPVTVVYVDEESREIVPVPLPRNVGRMSKPSKFRAHLPSECRNPQFCSFPHHQLAAKIMNQWRDRTVKVSKPPTLVRPQCNSALPPHRPPPSHIITYIHTYINLLQH